MMEDQVQGCAASSQIIGGQNDEYRRQRALELALGACGTHATKDMYLDMAEAFDAFLKGWEATDGNAA